MRPCGISLLPHPWEMGTGWMSCAWGQYSQDDMTAELRLDSGHPATGLMTHTKREIKSSRQQWGNAALPSFSFLGCTAQAPPETRRLGNTPSYSRPCKSILMKFTVSPNAKESFSIFPEAPRGRNTTLTAGTPRPVSFKAGLGQIGRASCRERV